MVKTITEKFSKITTFKTKTFARSDICSQRHKQK